MHLHFLEGNVDELVSVGSSSMTNLSIRRPTPSQALQLLTYK